VHVEWQSVKCFFCTLFQVCIRRCDLVAECDLALFLSTIVVFFFEEEHRLFFFSTIVRHCSSRLLSDIVLLDYCSLLLRRRTSTKSTLNMHWDTSDTMSTPKHHDKLTLSCSKLFSMSNQPWYYDRAKPFRCWCCDILWYFFACRDLRWQCSFARIWLMLLVLWPAPTRNEDAASCFSWQWLSYVVRYEGQEHVVMFAAKLCAAHMDSQQHIKSNQKQKKPRRNQEPGTRINVAKFKQDMVSVDYRTKFGFWWKPCRYQTKPSCHGLRFCTVHVGPSMVKRTHSDVNRASCMCNIVDRK
jgi:hypothetical protein